MTDFVHEQACIECYK